MPAEVPGRVVLCVGGGIAAYKAPELVRLFVGRGHEVQVLMTNAAHQFATELSLATVSKRPVRTKLLDAAQEGNVGHIEIADWADLVVVAPGTANLMARARAGLADDIVTAVLLATKARVLWAPAMNTNMWGHPATQENGRVLAERGAQFVGPDRGELACGWVGEGRMIDPAVIVEAAESLLAGGQVPAPAGGSGAQGAFAGKKVLLSAGPTRAYIDPVRFVSNASSGVMGLELAAAARDAGASVTVVAGPVQHPWPAGVGRIDVETGEQMFEAMDAELREHAYDLVAMVAAVADLIPTDQTDHKLSKADALGRLESIKWKQEVDILATLVDRYRSKTRFLGFAAQTVGSDDPAVVEKSLIAYATEKLQRKGAHAVFVNRVGAPGTGFGSPTNAGLLVVDGDGKPPLTVSSGPPVSKSRLSLWLLDQVAQHVLQ
jgi:phosphopantothenoylcysteine decarboxylase/phosphopantothenate--cysteine ligase